jgi:hypothetical protein
VDKQLILSIGIVLTRCAAGQLQFDVDISVHEVLFTLLSIPEKLSPESEKMVHRRPRFRHRDALMLSLLAIFTPPFIWSYFSF